MEAQQNNGCGTCSGCSGHSAAPAVVADSPRGWRLIGSAVLSFLMPLVMAVIGASVAGAPEPRRFVGAFAGLAGGMILAAVLTRRQARTNCSLTSGK